MKHLLIITLLVVLPGCTAVSKWTNYQKACATDPACLEEAKGYAKVGEVVAGSFGPVAGAGAGATILFLALGILGAKKEKKNG